jgi:hypothetical protein
MSIPRYMEDHTVGAARFPLREMQPKINHPRVNDRSDVDVVYDGSRLSYAN